MAQRADWSPRAVPPAGRTGDCNVVIVVNHGVITVDDTVAFATCRAASIDRMCRLSYQVMPTGKQLTPIAERTRREMQRSLIDLKIVMSEGAIGWVPALLDRLHRVEMYSSMYGTWCGIAESSAEVLRRNFCFCAVEDLCAFALRDHIGIDHIRMEEDYSHSDSRWPRTLTVVRDSLHDLDETEIHKIARENVSRLYPHPAPASVVDDPESF